MNPSGYVIHVDLLGIKLPQITTESFLEFSNLERTSEQSPQGMVM